MLIWPPPASPSPSSSCWRAVRASRPSTSRIGPSSWEVTARRRSVPPSGASQLPRGSGTWNQDSSRSCSRAQAASSPAIAAAASHLCSSLHVISSHTSASSCSRRTCGAARRTSHVPAARRRRRKPAASSSPMTKDTSSSSCGECTSCAQRRHTSAAVWCLQGGGGGRGWTALLRGGGDAAGGGGHAPAALRPLLASKRLMRRPALLSDASHPKAPSAPLFELHSTQNEPQQFVWKLLQRRHVASHRDATRQCRQEASLGPLSRSAARSVFGLRPNGQPIGSMADGL